VNEAGIQQGGVVETGAASLSQEPAKNPGPRAGRWTGAGVVLLMLAGVVAVYCPWELFREDRTLYGIDFQNIHIRRLHYARESLFGPERTLPAWYTRELLGTPFWSNIQNFPWIPTRLILLGLSLHHVYPAAVNVAAVLSALFTYLYARKMGLGHAASAVSGWTFACAGFFASRVMAGHLPLLEAYPALPLLLWLIEGIASAPRPDRRLPLRVAGLGLSCAALSLAGHPQVPFYAMVAAGAYLLVRLRGRRAIAPLLAMALGVGMAGAVLWPMSQLILRSTRVLSLERAGNDLPYPYWRIGSMFFPWRDGWPAPVIRPGLPVALEPEHTAVFWDTVCYVGWLPLLAAGGLLVRLLRRRRLPETSWLFVAVMGTAAFVLALPFAGRLLALLPGTFLRSPARQMYLTTFSLAMGLGIAVHLLRQLPIARRWVIWSVLCAGIAVHAFDLGRHARTFVRVEPPVRYSDKDIAALRGAVGEGRMAIDYQLALGVNRSVDDVGFFDSIILARPYRAIMAMAGARPGLNVQEFNGVHLGYAALAGLCVQGVVSVQFRPDLIPVAQTALQKVYAVPDAAPRASFIPEPLISYVEESEMLERLRDPKFDLRWFAMLTPDKRPDRPGPPASASVEPRVSYARPGPDQIDLTVEKASRGIVRVAESWDPGWSASVDGKPAQTLCSDTFLTAVRVDAGDHRIRLTYRTPGARTGLAISIASLAGLLALSASCRRRAQMAA